MKRFVFVLIYTISICAVGMNIVSQMDDNKPANKQKVEVKQVKQVNQEMLGELDLCDDSLRLLCYRAVEEIK